MPTFKFPCPFCGRRMGVGEDLAGRQVRCPHCKQVVVAPLAPGTGPAPPPTAIVRPPAPPDLPRPASPEDMPTFKLPRREAPESIFGDPEESEDDVFGPAGGNRVQMPGAPGRPADPARPPGPPAAPTAPDPFSDLGTPAIPPPIPVNVPPPPPPGGTGTNPWAHLDAMDTETVPAVGPPARAPAPQPQPVPAPVPVPVAPPEPAELEDGPAPDRVGSRAVRRDEAGGGSTIFKVAFVLLLLYALVVTGLAVYGLAFRSGGSSEHPLSTVPDNFGEFGPAERKKVSQKYPLDGPLPAELKVTLGGKLRVGAVEVEPLRVEARDLRLVREGPAGRKTESTPGRALVLTLAVRNASDDLTLHPLDPAFNRKHVRGHPNPPGTGLVVGKDSFWGGPIDWPFPGGRREYEGAQENDVTPLRPGESREYAVFTGTGPEVRQAVRAAKEPLLWRVQVRRGRVEWKGKDVPVTAVIGVEFNPGDVKGL